MLKVVLDYFFGYLYELKAYQIWDLIYKKLIISPNIIFDEHNYIQEKLSK